MDHSSIAVQFIAEDGYALQGNLYQASHAKASIVVASATGVPQGFYRRFAEYACAAGFDVLCFDYRGIAASAPQQLKDFEMSYLDWGRLDLTAAIDVMALRKRDIFVVGHSYGGQALGLCSNHSLVRAMYCFGTGAGHASYMPWRERFKVNIMWNLIFPPLAAYFGYLPWQHLNMGSDLPLNVYKQWRKWCKHPHYFFADPDLAHLHTDYAQVKTAIYAVAALDDDWALPASRHAFMQHYRQAKMNYIDIQAQDYGLKSIGHMGYFRTGAEKIWDDMLSSFSRYLPY